MQVKISETYDLSTQVDKMGLVAVHTPTGPLLNKLYPGLVLNYDKFRYARCDITMACASLLPADPLQIGVEAGDIAPQDMFNPILYKAVSNDSMNQLLNYIQFRVTSLASENTEVDGTSLVDINSADFIDNDLESTALDQFDMYYGLLADPKGWKKAMPQAGLQMRNLRPLVYSVVTNSGPMIPGQPLSVAESPSLYQNVYVNAVIGSSSDVQAGTGYIGGPSERNNSVGYSRAGVAYLRGRACRMPWLPTKSFVSTTGDDELIVPEGVNASLSTNTGRVPPTYVACMIVPPARLNRLYYRMRITWTVEFKDLRSMTPYLGYTGLADVASYSYGTDYDAQSATMTSIENMVDTTNVSMEKIMEA